MKIVIASGSPRRRELIKKIKYVDPIFMPTAADEVTLDGAAATAMANALIKGECAMNKTALPVLAFDTVVGIGDKVFGKPRTRAEAINMFETLCGATHEVVTGVFLGYNGKKIIKSEKTLVTFGAFAPQLVYNYVDSGAPFDKAGGYNIDDDMIKPLIERFDGEYDNVVGLPIGLTEKLIEEILLNGEDGYSA